MNKNRTVKVVMVLTSLLTACGSPSDQSVTPEKEEMKINVYQVFTRLFGNTDTTNKPWGTTEENGVGKFEDFTDRALDAISGMGITPSS